MPLFKCEALDKRGKMVRMTIDLPSADAAVSKLREMGYYPTKVEPAEPGTNPEIAMSEDMARTEAADTRIRAALQEAKDAFSDGNLSLEELAAAIEALVPRAAEASQAVQDSVRQHIDDLRAGVDPEALRAQLQQLASDVDAERQRAEAVAALQRQGKPEGFAEVVEYAAGWLQEPVGERCGALCLGGNRDVVWVDQDPATRKPTAVKSLCRMDEFESLTKRGLFKKRAELKASGGRAWTIRLDPKRPLANIPRLVRVISFELRQAGRT